MFKEFKVTRGLCGVLWGDWSNFLSRSPGLLECDLPADRKASDSTPPRLGDAYLVIEQYSGRRRRRRRRVVLQSMSPLGSF